MQNHEDMNLVLSTDAKPRLKWTTELHQRFVEAINHLGGADKATPKSLMRVMGITGLTLYHLKSHLQKYRLGKSQLSETNSHFKLEDMQREERHWNGENRNESRNESMKISEAVEMQLEVEKRVQEQIEVQRHLQVRIEAQGKYLETVLRKAQETIAGYGYGCCSEAMEQTKAELSQLASMVSSDSLSELTELTELTELRVTRMCSIETSLTSHGKKRKEKEESSSSVCEGDCKRIIIDLNDDTQIGMGSHLIHYL